MITYSEIDLIATEAGLAKVGISPVTVKDKYIQKLERFLQMGYYGEMTFIARWRNFNSVLKNQLPWAKTVIVALDNYFSPQTWDDQFPRWSRYVWGEDYHVIVRRKLQKVLARLHQSHPEVVGKIFVDTGPIFAKAYAEQAGLGWIGHNCLLIGENIGSFCFIGLLFTNLELEGSRTLSQAGCGTCRLCLDACPTGALIAPGCLDARRCISYLTIEKKTPLTDKESEFLKGQLYGCDRCQDVCPYNRKWAYPTSDERYRLLLPALQRSLAD